MGCFFKVHELTSQRNAVSVLLCKVTAVSTFCESILCLRCCGGYGVICVQWLSVIVEASLVKSVLVKSTQKGVN